MPEASSSQSHMKAAMPLQKNNSTSLGKQSLFSTKIKVLLENKSSLSCFTLDTVNLPASYNVVPSVS